MKTLTIKDPLVASVVFDAAFQAYLGVDKALSEVTPKLSSEELRECKMAIGTVMGNILTELTEPILRDHPQLLPKEWKKPSDQLQA